MKSKSVHKLLSAILVFAMMMAMLPLGIFAAEETTAWDFRLDEYTGQAEYNGLTLSGNFAKHDSTYGVRMSGGTITVPVSGPSQIKLTVGYNWDITFPDGSNFTHNSSDPVVYNYTGEAGTVAITVGTSCTSYIAQIELLPVEAEAEPVTLWDFSAEDFTGEGNEYNTLKWTNAKKNKTYLLANTGTISVPVSGACDITVSACYQYSFYFAKEDEASVGQKTGSTSQIDSFTYSYEGEAGFVDITVLGQSYLTKIEVTPKAEPVTFWDFRLDEYEGQTAYHGLNIQANLCKKHSANYGLQINGGTVSVPVSGPSEIFLSLGYNWDITFPDGTRYLEKSDKNEVISYIYMGEAGMVDITVGSEVTSYIRTIEVVEKDVSAVPELTPGKIYVWDFGAEQLEGEQYVNMLTVDEINSWYAEGTAVGTGVNLASFTCSDGYLSFNDGGYPTTHRLRSMNEALIRYDNKSLKDANGNVYNGYIYSNKSSDKGVYVSIRVNAGEKVTLAVGSNGGNSLINFESPTGVVTTGEYLSSGAKIQLLSFYPTESGEYKIYSSTEKLVLARIYREATSDITVSGTISAPDALQNYSICFTNTLNGAQYISEVNNGSYSVTLKDGYSYGLTLLDANGYVISSDRELTFDAGCGNTVADVTVEAVELVTVTGTLAGVDAATLAKLTLAFNAESLYIPQITISGNTYTAILEKGMTYALVLEGINDYTIASETTVCYEADTTVDITLQAKPVYAITIDPVGIAADVLANATFTFTNLNEEGYVYTFVGTENIALRDGVYAVKVTNSGAFVQQLTSNVKVNGEAITKTIKFSDDITKWDFSNADFTGEGGGFQGLTWTNAQKNKTYLLAKDGTISIPVKGGCQIKVSACYQYSFYFVSEEEASVDQKSGSTSQIDTYTYIYTGEAGVVTLHVLGTSYLTSIEIIRPVEYRETITVGASGCDYTTIGAALQAVKAMTRPNNERVTILIQPGNYEEMLVVDVPNVTLKNASENPSIGLTNQGVDIEENAVRITWYYGHGYTYYSMGTDCKFDAELLQVNKENGYPSFENPGSGTTNGSYWNSTVVVYASGFQASGIIFENSFNQYISQAAANDILVKQGGAKEGSIARADLPVGSVMVQEKAYVERAGALAIADNCLEVYFENCKFIGRQDTLYGGKGTTAAFYDCAILGGTDYIYGGMTAVFAKCDLVFNTSEDKNDAGYITAAQQASGRGFLFYNCRVTSTTPGVDTASATTSKPGYFGRPWTAHTGEAVFYNTIIEAADESWHSTYGASLIRADGWLSTLSGESELCGEYGTMEVSGVNNAANRVKWAAVFETAVLADGTPITIEAFLGDWDAFADKDLTMEDLSCKHTTTKTEGAVEATCEEKGFTGNTVCADCGELIAEGTEIAALGHNYDGKICTVCGNPKTFDVFGILVAVMAASGTALVCLKKKED